MYYLAVEVLFAAAKWRVLPHELVVRSVVAVVLWVVYVALLAVAWQDGLLPSALMTLLSVCARRPVFATVVLPVVCKCAT